MSPFHLFHLFIDWSELVGVACLLVGVVGLRFSLFCLVADQSLRSSCLPMTNLAQLHDCHSCYDERSIDQKKKHVFVKNDILQPGAFDHSVLYATAQLTEGRSARDQPKQPPAKKSDLPDPFPGKGTGGSMTE